jgi:hypothetical protein
MGKGILVYSHFSKRNAGKGTRVFFGDQIPESMLLGIGNLVQTKTKFFKGSRDKDKRRSMQ